MVRIFYIKMIKELSSDHFQGHVLSGGKYAKLERQGYINKINEVNRGTDEVGFTRKEHS
jgi:hypothetical protein